MKKIILFVNIILLLVVPNLYCEDQSKYLRADFKKIYEYSKDAIATVYVYNQKDEPISQGSGFFISEEGLFITNHHVIATDDKESYSVIRLANGALFPVKEYVGIDANYDIAVLKVDGKNLSYLEFGNSYDLSVGDNVAVISSPHGLENSMSTGIVSAIRNAIIEYFDFY